jgi:hypothetical protein
MEMSHLHFAPSRSPGNLHPRNLGQSIEFHLQGEKKMKTERGTVNPPMIYVGFLVCAESRIHSS